MRGGMRWEWLERVLRQLAIPTCITARARAVVHTGIAY